jgi:hypothetical protein
MEIFQKITGDSERNLDLSASSGTLVTGVENQNSCQ